MRIFLVWPTPAREIKILIDAITGAGHKIAYFVGENAVADLCPKDAIFHDHYDAWGAKPAPQLSDLRFAPPSAVEIESRTALESQILSMMDKRYDSAPVDERKHIYYSMLSYWTRILDETKPEAIVFAIIPHSLYANILYELAHERKIPTLCYEDAWTMTRVLSYEDFWSGDAELKNALGRLGGKKVIADELPHDLRSYWEKHSKPHSRITPPAIAFQKRTAVGLGQFTNRVRIALLALAKGELPILIWKYLKQFVGSNLKTDYMRVQKEVDWAIPFVYFPLHMQPERATSPQAGVYHDQILIAETLSASLPEGWQLYIKEHPSQWWLRTKLQYNSARYRGYYDRLASIPNVRVVPIECDTFDLIERSEAVATATGTAGWEGILRGKCAITFGYAWYRDCPGSLFVNSVESCTKAFAKIMSGTRPTDQDVLRFLKALGDTALYGNIDSVYESTPYTVQENMLRVAGRVVSQLSKFDLSRRKKRDDLSLNRGSY